MSMFRTILFLFGGDPLVQQSPNVLVSPPNVFTTWVHSPGLSVCITYFVLHVSMIDSKSPCLTLREPPLFWTSNCVRIRRNNRLYAGHFVRMRSVKTQMSSYLLWLSPSFILCLALGLACGLQHQKEKLYFTILLSVFSYPNCVVSPFVMVYRTPAVGRHGDISLIVTARCTPRLALRSLLRQIAFWGSTSSRIRFCSDMKPIGSSPFHAINDREPEL